jgi:hypothetical protein
MSDLARKLTPVQYARCEETAKKTVKKYFEGFGQINCPRCNRNVDTLIINNLFTCCAFCQDMNVMDLFSVLSKVPEGKDQVAAFLAVVDESSGKHDPLSITIKPLTYTFKSRVLNWATRGKHPLKIKRFGELHFPVNPNILGADIKEFDSTMAAAVVVTKQELIKQFFPGMKIGISREKLAAEVLRNQQEKAHQELEKARQKTEEILAKRPAGHDDRIGEIKKDN